MSGFVVSGDIGGMPALVTWTDGELDGDGRAIARVLELVGAGDVVSITPTGPHLVAELADPLAAFATIRAVFDGTVEASGELPKVEQPPRGAVP